MREETVGNPGSALVCNSLVLYHTGSFINAFQWLSDIAISIQGHTQNSQKLEQPLATNYWLLTALQVSRNSRSIITNTKILITQRIPMNPSARVPSSNTYTVQAIIHTIIRPTKSHPKSDILLSCSIPEKQTSHQQHNIIPKFQSAQQGISSQAQKERAKPKSPPKKESKQGQRLAPPVSYPSTPRIFPVFKPVHHRLYLPFLHRPLQQPPNIQ